MLVVVSEAVVVVVVADRVLVRSYKSATRRRACIMTWVGFSNELCSCCTGRVLPLVVSPKIVSWDDDWSWASCETMSDTAGSIVLMSSGVGLLPPM